MKKPATESYQGIRRVGTLLSIPLTLGLAPIVGCAIGWALDRLCGTRPLFTFLLLLVGFVSGIRETWILIRRAEEDDQKPDAKSRVDHK